MRPFLLFAPLLLGFVTFQGAGGTAAFPTGTVTALGACDVRPESVSCWDMDGKAAEELAISLRSYLSNGNDVSFRFGKKNRYLITRRPQTLQPQYRTGPNNYVNSSSTYNADPVMDFLRIAVDPMETEVVVSVTTTIQSPTDEEIDFKEGAIKSIDGRQVEIGPSAKVVDDRSRPAANPYGQPIVGPAWNVPIAVSGGDGDIGYWAYTPLDGEGNPIRFVDASGKPISALKALALEPHLQPGNGFYYPNGQPSAKPKAANAYFQGGGGAAFRAVTNVEPKFIAKLRIKTSRQESKDLGPFPLDPK